MINTFFLWFREMPAWASAEFALLGFVLLMLGILLHRQQKLSWYLVPLLTISMMMAVMNTLLPDFHSWLISTRPDWSLLHAVQNPGFYALTVQLLFMGIYYGLLSLMVFFFFALWSLLSFRWDRFQILWMRGTCESWLVLWFVGITVLLFQVVSLGVPVMTLEYMELVLQALGVLFVLQLSVRMLDSAHFQRSQDFLLLNFWMGMLMLTSLWVPLAYQYQSGVLSFSAMFWQQLLSFFVMMLSYGFLAGFLLSARFSRRRRSAESLGWLKQGLYTVIKRRETLVYMGTFIAAFLVVLSFAVAEYLSLLLLFPLFFVGYFLLFCWNDFQEDLRKKGWLVQDRREVDPETIPSLVSYMKHSHH